MKIKLFLLWLITPLLFGVSFWFDLTSDEITFLNNNATQKWSFTNVWNYTLLDYWSVPSERLDYCFIFSWFLYNNSTAFPFSLISTVNTSPTAFSPERLYGSVLPYSMYCFTFTSRYVKLLKPENSSYTYSADYFWSIEASKIFNGSLWFDIQWLLDSYDTCSNNLNQCDTSVQQCLLDKDNLSTSLTSCESDKSSLQNYNDSLTSQLNQCLNSNLTWDFFSWGFLRYSLFWNDDESMFSLPITNDLFLPVGYKWKLNEDNVLSIAPINTIENALLFDDEAKNTTVNSLAYIMLFLIASGLIMVLLRFLKKLFKL